MNLSNLSLMRMARQQMDWTGQRQAVLSQNIANSDTPNYKAKDLAAIDFKARIGKAGSVNLAKTAGQHLQGTSVKPDWRVERSNRDDLYEIAPDGNQVVLEEQMMKVADTQARFQLASNVYRKNLQMFRMALNGNQQ
jgi:flagellar basal-body rod protein FlgB